LETTKAQALAAAILAGGHARRLGGINKGALEIGGAAIADRQLEVLRSVAQDVFVVGHADDVWAARGLRVVPDEIVDAGPLGGIYTALVHSPAERTLVVGCDMPFIAADVLERLAAVDGADVVVARSARGLEPLCAIYSRACAGDIRARLERGAYEASTLPAGFRVAEVGVERALVFVNVNTPHDYERAKGLVERQPKPKEDRITTGRDRPMTDSAS
jgi:molybdopterin-guanine dinucleotide biosynthesis protein A